MPDEGRNLFHPLRVPLSYNSSVCDTFNQVMGISPTFSPTFQSYLSGMGKFLLMIKRAKIKMFDMGLL